MKIKDIYDLPKYDEFHPNEWIARKNQHKNEAIKGISDLDVKLTLDEEILSQILQNFLAGNIRTVQDCIQLLKSKAEEIIIKSL